MTALAQGSAGLALAMCFALLLTLRVGSAVLLLAIQSGAVAVSAMAQDRPLLALPPVLLGGGAWLVRHHVRTGGRLAVRQVSPSRGRVMAGGRPDAPAVSPSAVEPGLAVAAVLAVLCQSQGELAVPMAIVLLSILLAATRTQPSMQVIALVAAQNGLVLAGCVAGQPAPWPEALVFASGCLLPPFALAAYLVVPFRTPRTARGAAWFGWIDLGLALGVVAASLIVPADPLARVFAPLLGLDGVLQAWVRRRRTAMPPENRVAALLRTGFAVAAVSVGDPRIAWLAVLGSMVMALLPTLSRRWQSAVPGLLAASLGFFGISLLPASGAVLGWFSLFAGSAMIAAIVPDLATVLVVAILRLALKSPWPPAVEALGLAVALTALMSCAALLTGAAGSRRATLLTLGQASIAALSICTGQPEGRFAALILLILLTLTRSAARARRGPAASLAMAGLSGIPPLGVFPGLVLVAAALASHDPWLLIPLGIAMVPIGLAGVDAGRAAWSEQPATAAVPATPGDTSLPAFLFRTALPPVAPWAVLLRRVAWLPLLLAAAVGYFVPAGTVQWLRLLAAGGN